jgi:hypothetical protein
MCAFDAFWHMDMRSFHGVNEVLLPKTDEANTVRDYRLIALIHNIGKLFAKVLVGQLAPQLSELVHPYQNAFIKGRSIHDNFRLVHSSVRLMHTRRSASLLLKVDIARAFDLVT